MRCRAKVRKRKGSWEVRFYVEELLIGIAYAIEYHRALCHANKVQEEDFMQFLLTDYERQLKPSTFVLGGGRESS